MNRCLILLLVVFTVSCTTSKTPLPSTTTTERPRCAISFLKLSEQLTLGTWRESAFTHTYRRPRVRTVADSAFVSRCSEQFTIIPDDSLKRIVGVTSNTDTIMNRLHENNISLLMLPSINGNGELQIELLQYQNDSVQQSRLVSDNIFQHCESISMLNQSELHRCIAEQITNAADSLIRSLL